MEQVIISEVSSFQRLQEWYILGVGKGERCPQFRGDLIEREVPLLQRAHR